MLHNKLQLDDIAPEVLLLIYSFLDIKDLASLALVSKQHRALANDGAIWANLFAKCKLGPLQQFRERYSSLAKFSNKEFFIYCYGAKHRWYVGHYSERIRNEHEIKAFMLIERRVTVEEFRAYLNTLSEEERNQCLTVKDREYSLLHHAAKYGLLDIVQYLFRNQADDASIILPRIVVPSPLRLATQYGHGEVINFFLEEEQGTEEDLFLFAISSNRKESVQAFLENSSEVYLTLNNDALLIEALKVGNLEILSLLMQYGCQITHEALEFLIQHCDEEEKYKDIYQYILSIIKEWDIYYIEIVLQFDNACAYQAFIHAKLIDVNQHPLPDLAEKGCIRILNTVLALRQQENTTAISSISKEDYRRLLFQASLVKINLLLATCKKMTDVQYKYFCDTLKTYEKTILSLLQLKEINYLDELYDEAEDDTLFSHVCLAIVGHWRDQISDLSEQIYDVMEVFVRNSSDRIHSHYEACIGDVASGEPIAIAEELHRIFCVVTDNRTSAKQTEKVNELNKKVISLEHRNLKLKAKLNAKKRKIRDFDQSNKENKRQRKESNEPVSVANLLSGLFARIRGEDATQTATKETAKRSCVCQ